MPHHVIKAPKTLLSLLVLASLGACSSAPPTPETPDEFLVDSILYPGWAAATSIQTALGKGANPNLVMCLTNRYWRSSKNGVCPGDSLRRSVLIHFSATSPYSAEVRIKILKMLSEKGGHFNMEDVAKDRQLSNYPVVENILSAGKVEESTELLDAMLAMGYKPTKADHDYFSKRRSGKILLSKGEIEFFKRIASPEESIELAKIEKKLIEEQESKAREDLLRQKEMEKWLQEQARVRELNRKAQELQRAKDIEYMRKSYGAQVCKTGTVMYQPTYGDYVANSISRETGQAKAVIESVSADGMRIQIRINGFSLTKAKTVVAPSMDGMKLEQGGIYWDSINNWFPCNFQ